MSIAVLVSTVFICAGVKAGLAALIKAAMAAACGAAADVPKNGLGNPPAPETLTPSAAVISGFCNSRPPVDDRFPGVIAAPLPLKKIRRGPSELNVSTVLLELKTEGNVQFAQTAATPKPAEAALWPCVSPSVLKASWPRLVARWRKRLAAPVLRRTTTLLLVRFAPFN